MNFNIDILKDLIRLGSSYNLGTTSATSVFEQLIEPIALLNQQIEESNFDDQLKKIIRQNTITNLVSLLENYFKETIIQFQGTWDTTAINNSLKEKITLAEAFDHIKGFEISKEAIIAKFISFQKIENIQKTFSSMTNSKDFFNDLERFADTIARGRNCKDFFQFTIKQIPDCRKKLIELFKLRNQIVNEPAVKIELTAEDLINFISLAALIVATTSRYFERLATKQKKSRSIECQ